MPSDFAPRFWQAPLVPVAAAATAGALADRYAGISLWLSLPAVAACLAAWAAARTGKKTGLSVVYLLASAFALGSAYHHWWRQLGGPDDIGQFASANQGGPPTGRSAAQRYPAVNHPGRAACCCATTTTGVDGR